MVERIERVVEQDHLLADRDRIMIERDQELEWS